MSDEPLPIDQRALRRGQGEPRMTPEESRRTTTTTAPLLPPSVQEARDQVNQPGPRATLGEGGAAAGFNTEPIVAEEVSIGPSGVQMEWLQPQRRGGGRADPRAWEPHTRTQEGYGRAAQDLEETSRAVGELSRRQAEASFRGIQEGESRRRRNEEERLDNNRRADQAWNTYLGAQREVDEMQELNPGRVWARMDTPTRVIAGIAMGLQGGVEMFGGEAVQDGPIQRMQALIAQDLELQQEEFRRGRLRAQGRQNIYSLMRQRFSEDATANNMAEAAAWNLVARRINTYGRQIQNQGARTRLTSLAAQATERSNAAALSGLQAQRAERRRVAGSVRYPVRVTMPDGSSQTVNMSARQRREFILEQAENAQERFDTAIAAAGTRGAQEEQQRRSAALQEWRRWARTGLSGTQNLSRTTDLLRELVEQGRAEGVEGGEEDLGPMGFWNILAGDSPLAQYVNEAVNHGGGGEVGNRLRQSFGQDVFNYVFGQSGAQVSIPEFNRRTQAMAGAMQNTPGIAFGIGMMADQLAGGANVVRGAHPGVYSQNLRNLGVVDPVVTLERVGQTVDRLGNYEPSSVWAEAATWRARDGGGQFDVEEEEID